LYSTASQGQTQPQQPTLRPRPALGPRPPQAAGLAFIPSQKSLFGVAAVFGSVAVSWNVVNTAGNVLSLQQSPPVRPRLRLGAS
jgi:hypothetical protein